MELLQHTIRQAFAIRNRPDYDKLTPEVHAWVEMMIREYQAEYSRLCFLSPNKCTCGLCNSRGKN